MYFVHSALVWATLLAIVTASPAAAVQRFSVFLTGELVQQSGPNSIPDLPFGTGSTLQAAWDVDMTMASRTALPPSGGTGTAANFGGVITNGVISIASETAILLMFQNARSPGNIFAVDNGSTPPPPIPGGVPLRFDQLTLSDGALLSPDGLIQRYNLLPVTDNIPAALFLSSLLFGSNQNAPSDPSMLTTTETIDPFSVWQFAGAGPQPVFRIQFRLGNPTSPAEFGALPNTRFSLRNTSVFLTPLPNNMVPEPQSWAMLIIGFGLVGTMVRRKRMHKAAA